MKTCAQCSARFQIHDQDRSFYAKIEVPEPKLCADCRMQRIICFRNERKLYKRTCDLSGKQIISIYDQHTEFPVYEHNIWWTDQLDALQYGQDFDFSRTFFEQFAELQTKVPKIALMARNCQNSDYVNNEEEQKNCYMTFAGAYCEDSYYSRLLLHSKDCMDCLNTSHAELCYGCVNVFQSYHCVDSQDLKNCRDIFFSKDLVGCQDCIACIGLRNKRYHILNKSYSPEEYSKLKADLMNDYHAQTQMYLEEYEKLKTGVPHRFAQIVNCQNCTGDDITSSKNCIDCFDVRESEDCMRIQDGQYCKDCVDCFLPYEAEFSYNSMGVCVGLLRS